MKDSNSAIRTLNGETQVLWQGLLREMIETVKEHENKEIVLCNTVDSKSPPEVVKLWQEAKEVGATFKFTAEEGDTFLQSDLENYRYIPKQYFSEQLILLFGDKTAFQIQHTDRMIVIENKDNTEALRNLVHTLWDVLPQPTERTTKQKY